MIAAMTVNRRRCFEGIFDSRGLSEEEWEWPFARGVHRLPLSHESLGIGCMAVLHRDRRSQAESGDVGTLPLNWNDEFEGRRKAKSKRRVLECESWMSYVGSKKGS
jgi:hypothetical protein